MRGVVVRVEPGGGEAMNLLQETHDAIKTSGHSVGDIAFIGSEKSGHRCSWSEFELLADQDYDCGFGGQKVASDLVIVFSDGTKMWRGEYDGSEWWDYSAPFVEPSESRPIQKLFAEVGWDNLSYLNPLESADSQDGAQVP